MKDLVRSYDVHGMGLAVRAESRELLSHVHAILNPFEALPGADDFSFLLRYGTPPTDVTAREGVRAYWRGELPGGLPAISFTGDGSRGLIVPERTQLLMDMRRRAAEMTVAPGAEWCLNLGCILPALCEFLQQTGQHVVHAASLYVEDGGEPCAILICGQSGLGKTTAALALALAGMRLMADDASFVRTADEAPDSRRIWGLPRPCRVHPNTLALLPRLNGILPCHDYSDDEYLLDLQRVPGADARGEARPRWILFLQDRNPKEHRLRPVDKVTAITRLAQENLRTADPSAEGAGGQAFAALTGLVRDCDTYLLSVGPQPDTLHKEVFALLART